MGLFFEELFWISKQKQFMYTTCSELVIFMNWTWNSMNNLLSYCGLLDAKISASDKNLTVLKDMLRGQCCTLVWIPSLKFKSWTNSNNDEAVSKKNVLLKAYWPFVIFLSAKFPTCQLPKGTYVLYIVLVHT